MHKAADLWCCALQTLSKESPPKVSSLLGVAQDHAYRVFKTLSPDLPCDFFLSFLSESHLVVALLYLLNLVLLIQFDLAYYISSVYPITGAPILITTKISQQIQCNTCQNSSTILFHPRSPN